MTHLLDNLETSLENHIIEPAEHLKEHIEDWFIKHFHGTKLSQDTRCYNEFYAMKESLKRKVEHIPDVTAEKAAEILEKLFDDHFNNLRFLPDAENYSYIFEAKEALKKEIHSISNIGASLSSYHEESL